MTANLFPAPAIPEAFASSRFRIMQVDSPNMEPTLWCRRDYVLLSPLDSYIGEGIYAVEDHGAICLYRCQRTNGNCIRVFGDNKDYSEEVETLEAFNASVVAKVAAILKVDDYLLLEGRPRPGMEPTTWR